MIQFVNGAVMNDKVILRNRVITFVVVLEGVQYVQCQIRGSPKLNYLKIISKI